jgi:hypothetical protein
VPPIRIRGSLQSTKKWNTATLLDVIQDETQASKSVQTQLRPQVRGGLIQQEVWRGMGRYCCLFGKRICSSGRELVSRLLARLKLSRQFFLVFLAYLEFHKDQHPPKPIHFVYPRLAGQGVLRLFLAGIWDIGASYEQGAHLILSNMSISRKVLVNISAN